MLESGEFRGDLYHRLQAHHIHIPPLRQRKEDIPLLVNCFLKEAALKNGMTPPSQPAELFPLLEKYDFPGNISELKQMVAEAVSRYKRGMLPLDVFLLKVQKIIDLNIESPENEIYPKVETPTYERIIFRGALPSFEEMEAFYLDEIMKRSGKNYSLAARLAGLDQQSFIQLLKKANKAKKR
jgi:transcriptional regulator with GAF, ATPase, and Fis domain